MIPALATLIYLGGAWATFAHVRMRLDEDWPHEPWQNAAAAAGFAVVWPFLFTLSLVALVYAEINLRSNP